MSVKLISRLGLLAGLSMAGIALAQGPTQAPVAKPPVVAAPVDAKAQELVERMCSGCHEYGTVSSQSRTDTEWAETLDRMIGYGAQMTPEDQKSVQAFLTAHYGKKAE